MRRVVLVAVVCICMMCAGPAFAQHKAMTNQDVIDMVGFGLGDDVVIEKIRTAEATSFDTSLDGLKALKAAKVSDAVIKVVVNPKAGAVATTAASLASEWPEEVGVYAYVKGKLVEVTPEIVNWRSGGVLKSMATGGLTKGHVNGSIREGKSPLQTTPPVEFIIKTPEGTSVAEYQLLKLDAKSDRREFRAITGGIIHMSGGADKNAVDFKFDKVASRTFKVKIENIGKGEYGFLPPGVNSQSMASGGKIYTFGIME